MVGIETNDHAAGRDSRSRLEKDPMGANSAVCNQTPTPGPGRPVRAWAGGPRRALRAGAVAACLAALGLTHAIPALGATAPVAAPPTAIVRHQDQAQERAQEGLGASTAVDILHRQGAEGAASLERMAGVDVENPLPMPMPAATVAITIEPTPTVDLAATAEANAAAAAAAAAAEANAAAAAAAEANAAASAEATAAATATAEARAEMSQMLDAALAARDADAAATATTVAQAEQAAADAEERVAAASARAIQAAVARAMHAAPTPAPEAPPAAPDPGTSIASDPVSLVSLALAPLLALVLIFRIWRRKSEPFVIKAKPVAA